jgi:hypothetical protein
LLALAILLLFLVFAAPAAEIGTEEAVSSETALQRILRTGTVRIGYVGEAPYAFWSRHSRSRRAIRRTFTAMRMPRVIAPSIRDRSIYYGACGFRFQDADLLAAFNRHLLEFRGTPEHLALVANFGVTRDTLRNRTTAEICGH